MRGTVLETDASSSAVMLNRCQYFIFISHHFYAIFFSPTGRYTLLGLVSWGKSCGKAQRPGIYTNVKHYLDWIMTAMEDL